MSGEIGAAGDIATGMLVGRVAEPQAGETGHRKHEHGLCLNCGTALQGDFCHACGQAGHVHRSLHSIGHDLLHGVFHFEGKVWRTLPMLVFYPGGLTRRYIAGERARFVSPLALFLFSVFLMFAVFHASSGGEVVTRRTSPAERAAAVAQLDAQIREAKAELAAAQRAGKSGVALAPEASVLETLQRSRDAFTGGTGHENIDIDLHWPALEHVIAKVKENPDLLFYKLQSSAYKYSWALIPISVPLVALLFLWRRQFKLYDHAIFVTYSLSFMMLLVVAVSVGRWVGLAESPMMLIACVVPPIHMFAQVRGAYGLRKRSALWRTVALLLFACIALTAFAAMLLAMGLME